MTEQPETTGVQELIDRLSQEGVAEGQEQAEKIIREAHQKADDIVEAARQRAAELKEKARAEASDYQSAGEEALQLAARDAVRDFGAKIHNGLKTRLQKLVQHELQQPDLIKRMILEITSEVTRSNQNERLEVLLPREIVSEEKARKLAQDGTSDELTEFVQGLVGEDLRNGVSVSLGSHRQNGITVRVVDQNVEIDLSDETITELLARHMLPRFRAVMRKG